MRPRRFRRLESGCKKPIAQLCPVDPRRFDVTFLNDTLWYGELAHALLDT